MQHLLVDIGNQRLKWVAVDLAPDLSIEKIAEMVEAGTTAEQTGLSDDWLDGLAAESVNPERILVSSVGRQKVREEFHRYCQANWGIKPEYLVSPSEYLGLTNDYLAPAQLGCDRWLAALAAYHLVGFAGRICPLAIVDAGTAITVDLIVSDHFKGGAILPGFATIVRSMAGGTGEIRIDIPTVLQSMLEQDNNPSIAGNQVVLANNSADAVLAGALMSIGGGVERCLDQIASGLVSAMKIIVTGGDAALIEVLLKRPCKVVPNLVLAGLAVVAKQNLARVSQ